LQSYDWPGNVRELENVIERAVVLAQGSTITTTDLNLETPLDRMPTTSDDYFVVPADATLAQVEREIIAQALQRSAGNRQATARRLNIGVSTLYRKLKEYQLA
jgi:DNA-binding NtrC family response regulator